MRFIFTFLRTYYLFLNSVSPSPRKINNYIPVNSELRIRMVSACRNLKEILHSTYIHILMQAIKP